MTPDLRTPPRATALVRIMERCTSSAHHPGWMNLRRARALSVGECVTARTPRGARVGRQARAFCSGSGLGLLTSWLGSLPDFCAVWH